MALQPALFLRYGVKHARHTVADIVAYHIAHIQRREHHARSRQQYIQVVAAFKIDMGGQARRYGVYEELEHNGRKTAENTHKKGKHKHKILLLDMALAPHQKVQKHLSYPSLTVYLFLFAIHKNQILIRIIPNSSFLIPH